MADGFPYGFGMEEEYFLTDVTTRDSLHEMPPAFFEACKARLGDAVEREMLQTQIEVATPPLTDMAEALALLRGHRAAIAEAGREHGIAVLAAGTHPKAAWSRQRPTEAQRYRTLMKDLQMLGSRNMVCGMHVHVSVPDPDARVDLMRRITPFLPLLLALSAASPFWQGRRTGLMAYRLAAYDELPRTGLPDFFANAADYERYVAAMVAAGAIADSSFLWWVIRPSRRYPTLELRIADSCTSLADAGAIAALYRGLVRRLCRDPSVNALIGPADRAIAAENKWRAQRFGAAATFVDPAGRGAVPARAALDDLLALVAEDLDALGCRAQAEAARAVFARGTSADRQIAAFTEARGRGSDRHRALDAVVDWLVAATQADEAAA